MGCFRGRDRYGIHLALFCMFRIKIVARALQLSGPLRLPIRDLVVPLRSQALKRCFRELNRDSGASQSLFAAP